MPEEEHDIESEVLPVPDEDDGDPRAIAYKMAVWIMEEFKPGFVVIGSPHMGTTESGYLYPDAVGIVINNDVELTPFGLATVLEELASQLNSNVDEIEDYLKETEE